MSKTIIHKSEDGKTEIHQREVPILVYVRWKDKIVVLDVLEADDE